MRVVRACKPEGFHQEMNKYKSPLQLVRAFVFAVARLLPRLFKAGVYLRKEADLAK